MMVGGYHAVYIDQAAEGARPADGGPPLQLGRLVVERPDLVLIASATGATGWMRPPSRWCWRRSRSMLRHV